MLQILAETPCHAAPREMLLDRTFGPARALKSSERLRENRLPAHGLAFAAEIDDRLVATLRFWSITAGPGKPALLLGPLAVDPSFQGQGLGSSMIKHGLITAAGLGHKAVLLVGDAEYYSRFGFSADRTAALWMPGPFERQRLLAIELATDALKGAAGMISATGAMAPTPALRDLILAQAA
jgi:predicted N-acetyltransferase YhbS